MHTLSSKNDKSNENTFFSTERGELVILSNNSAALFFLPSRLGNLDTNLFFCGCHEKLTLSNPTIAGLLRFLRFCLHWTFVSSRVFCLKHWFFSACLFWMSKSSDDCGNWKRWCCTHSQSGVGRVTAVEVLMFFHDDALWIGCAAWKLLVAEYLGYSFFDGAVVASRWVSQIFDYFFFFNSSSTIEPIQ